MISGSNLGKAVTAFGMAVTVLAAGMPGLAQAQEMTTTPAAQKVGMLLKQMCGIDAVRAPLFGKAILGAAEGKSDFAMDLSELNDQCQGATLSVESYNGNDFAEAKLEQNGRGISIGHSMEIKAIMPQVNFQQMGRQADCIEQLTARGITPQTVGQERAQSYLQACVAKR